MCEVAKYLLFDGTYFHKRGCLALLIDIVHKRLLWYEYIEREAYQTVYPMLLGLKTRGLNPAAITVDGHRMVIRAMLDTWPTMTIQRCLFHIQNQGLMWIRHRPKTLAGQELRYLLRRVTEIRCENTAKHFLMQYQTWHQKHSDSLRLLPKDSIANKDLKRTVSLIQNALPNMFHFIKDRNIAPTTNYLENLYSQLKHHYRCHRGLTEQNKIQYLKWYCYLKKGRNSSTI